MNTHHLKDLREHITALKEINELQEIDQEVDPNLEVGGIIRHVYDLRAPAPLFNNLKGVKSGFRILGAPTGVSYHPHRKLARLAMSLGYPATTSGLELVKRVAAALDKEPRPPKLLSTGPCKENILLGDAIDLEIFPIPLIHEGDGGRYFNTWGTVVCKTPNGEWTNWAIARAMVVNKNTLATRTGPTKNTTKIRQMWEAVNQPMPFAIFQGGAPLIPFVSALSLPEYTNEVDFAGGFREQAMPLVKCETVDLEVPADAEIVIEGTVSLTETAMEGPMGEFGGNLCSAAKGRVPVYNISAITYRNDPILPVVAAGYPVEDNHTTWGIGLMATIHRQLSQAGFPFSGCFIPFESSVHWLVVSIPRDYIWHEKKGGTYSVPKLIDELKDIVFEQKPGQWIPNIIVVADDVDPSDINDVVWSLATRCRPDQHLRFPDRFLGQPLVAFLSDDEKKSMRTSKMVFNCLRPDYTATIDIPKPAKFKSTWPPHIREKILRNWQSYGYD